MPSIRRYLLVSLIVSLTGGSLLIGAFTYFNATEEINELYDKSMQEVAATLQSQMEALNLNEYDIKGTLGASLHTGLTEEQEFLVQIWKVDKEPVYASHRAIPFPFHEKHGALITEFEGEKWRAYVAGTPHFVIQVSQPEKARIHFIREMALHLLYPMLAQIPLIGLFIWLAVGRSLAPLSEISRAISKRSATSLEPVRGKKTPIEIQPMVQELNALLVRLKSSLDTQKRFTADAAHELRTPLAALQLQLGILARAANDYERTQAKARLQQGIDRAAHVVQQLLILARLEPESTELKYAPIDLALIAHGIVERLADQAFQKPIDFGVSRAESAMVSGDREALGIAVENIVDNALRYTPEGGKVDICTYAQADEAIIEVQDNGIGIPEQERSRIFERFHRVVGTDTDGTGLGLAIAKNIVEQHGGTITVEKNGDGRGSRFTLRFPLRGKNHAT